MEDAILLAHGSGGKLSHDLIEQLFVPFLGNPILNKLDDSAVLEIDGRLAFTSDSYTVSPVFFPGGDIGRLAVCGTVNDLSMSGATPKYLSLSFIIEEGFSFSDLGRVLESIRDAAKEARVQIVTGDTKVVNRGSVDRLFINTAGIGALPGGVNISASNARPGDRVLLSGTIGDHGIAVMGEREGLRFKSPVVSDCAPLNGLVAGMLEASGRIKCLRDPTRGGLVTALNDFAAQSRAGIVIRENQIPVSRAVRAACELLGLDPLHIANEGKLVAVTAAEDTSTVLCAMKHNKYGANAVEIGEVVADPSGRVVMETEMGAHRILDMPVGELLPRIC